MRNVVLSVMMCLCFAVWCKAQEKFYVRDYKELSDGTTADEQEWKQCGQAVGACWGSTDIRYGKTKVAGLDKGRKLWRGKVWKGEVINLQAVVWAKQPAEIKPEITDLVVSSGQKIGKEDISLHLVRYVMTDELNKDKRGTCGYRPDRTLFDSSLVADVLDMKVADYMEARTVRPVWVKIRVPENLPAGVYRGKLSFGHPDIQPLVIEIGVVNQSLPSLENRVFRLDLWQNPFAVARFHGVDLWSKEHFEAMYPVMKLLVDAGQKTITASIMHKPWGGQTEDYFESMVMRIKRLDGSWQYDYAVFDKWVEFMMGLGIDRQINCYTMIPWDLSFQFFDQASNQLKFVKADVGTPAYNEYWLPFLQDFARHLKTKGWSDITTIAMDERPMAAMQKAIRLIREADPAYKVALAGNFHPEIEADIDDYCIALGQFFPENILKERQAAGKLSTYYTCCSESYPNTFTFSPPAEAVWLGWYAAAKGFDGYLRWAYNSWTKDPLTDSRFRAFGGGDCYLAYPGGRSSIRLEKLVEGIQDYEKVRVLKEKFTKEKNVYKLKKLEAILQDFEVDKLKEIPAADMVAKARKALDKL